MGRRIDTEIKKIEIDHRFVRVTRRWLPDSEEPLSAYLGISCRSFEDEETATPAYAIKLVHPDWEKSIELFEFHGPEFDMREVTGELSRTLGLPVLDVPTAGDANR